MKRLTKKRLLTAYALISIFPTFSNAQDPGREIESQAYASYGGVKVDQLSKVKVRDMLETYNEDINLSLKLGQNGLTSGTDIAFSFLNRGKVLQYFRHDYKLAIVDYGKAINFFGKSKAKIAVSKYRQAEVHLRRGECYLKLAKPNEASKDFAIAISEFEKLADAKFNAAVWGKAEALRLNAEASLKKRRSKINLVSAKTDFQKSIDTVNRYLATQDKRLHGIAKDVTDKIALRRKTIEKMIAEM